MSVEFRQRRPSEYLKIIRRRKWLIILPIIAVTSAVAWVVYRLPDVYESVTLIVVKPSTLPTTVVPTITEDSLTRQLTSIAQVVTSRSSLEPLVNQYELYKPERLRGVPTHLSQRQQSNRSGGNSAYVLSICRVGACGVRPLPRVFVDDHVPFGVTRNDVVIENDVISGGI